MISVSLYLIAGLIAYIWLCLKTKKCASSACSLFLLGNVSLVIFVCLWPIMIPLSLIDRSIQEQELKEKENRKVPTEIDLSLEVGKLGEALTAHSPAGRTLVDGREYETRSTLAFIPKGAKVRVVGHSMHQLQIEPAIPSSIVNTGKARD